jgi:hypothetical protein
MIGSVVSVRGRIEEGAWGFGRDVMEDVKKMIFDDFCVQQKEDSKSTGIVHVKTRPVVHS